MIQQRVIIIVLAVTVSLPFVLKSRTSAIISAPAAFSALSSARVTVRVSGDVRHAGIFEVGANTLTNSVIIMAEPDGAINRLIPEEIGLRRVTNGTDLHVSIQPDQTAVITAGTMRTAERIILAIPLDINSTSEADFDRLPGVGPVMARRIVKYRQNNGGKMKVEELTSVEGIGEAKYQKLRRYF